MEPVLEDVMAVLHLHLSYNWPEMSPTCTLSEFHFATSIHCEVGLCCRTLKRGNHAENFKKLCALVDSTMRHGASSPSLIKVTKIKMILQLDVVLAASPPPPKNSTKKGLQPPAFLSHNQSLSW
ncbi:Hypothetical predicted protein [Podarcis lilfordi]|uniref:Uncharacterized protein n=1 Tax=Podarcis lilfordi TaxID=74358 RepID=A0AA35NW35_9SAUR|nr:Hypothetical predicted protein [Podarcis lilfordi]